MLGPASWSMRYARARIPTLKEALATASSVSHVLLARANYVWRSGARVSSHLPLGPRTIERIIREELDRTGAVPLRGTGGKKALRNGAVGL